VNSIVKPRLLYALIVPPCISTNSLHIDKPNPDILLELSVVKNGSNILLTMLSSTPFPVSDMVNL